MKKFKFKTNSNTYTIIYATVIVVIVALLLSVVSSALRPKQEANVALDKKKQILSSLNINLKGQDADAIYAEVITEPQDDQLPVYIAHIDGATKYIIPMQGVGLWGAIWGYMALNEDKNTIFGIYFNHASETPGLGGEITNPKFLALFQGKHILREGKVAGLGVMKTGQTADGMEQVDAISGATITSKGVEDMINNTLATYESFLTATSEAVETNVEPANTEEE